MKISELDNGSKNTYKKDINVCNRNIDIIVNHFEEQVNIIKKNLDNLKNQANDPYLHNYYINNVMFLNKIMSDILLFRENSKVIMKIH